MGFKSVLFNECFAFINIYKYMPEQSNQNSAILIINVSIILMTRNSPLQNGTASGKELKVQHRKPG